MEKKNYAAGKTELETQKTAGQKKINEGKAEYESGKKEAEEKLAEGEEKIKDAEDKIADIPKYNGTYITEMITRAIQDLEKMPKELILLPLYSLYSSL